MEPYFRVRDVCLKSANHRLRNFTALLLLTVFALSACSALNTSQNATDPVANDGASIEAEQSAAANELAGTAKSDSDDDNETSSSKPTSSPVANGESLIIEDLVDTLSQILPPFSTTIQTSIDSSDKAGTRIVKKLANSGFGIQRVDADQGLHFLRYDIEQQKNAETDNTRYRISVGAIEIERTYVIRENGSVIPDSPMILGGTRADVLLDDSRFGPAGTARADHSQVRFLAATPVSNDIPTISLISSELVERVTKAAIGNADYRALNSSKLEVDNLFYANESNFGVIFDRYERVIRQVIVFGNDSLRLGADSKQLVRNLVSQYKEATDVFGVVGCSNGPTNLDIGNEGLALGRAERITDELLSMGVPRSDILDEGCWAPTTAGERFPGRGVVLELWREKA